MKTKFAGLLGLVLLAAPIVSYATLRGDDVVTVPEPGSLALLGMGIAGIVIARWRK